MYTLVHYGERNIANFELINSRRLQKEVGVLNKMIEGDTQFLNEYDKIRKKITNINIISNIISMNVIGENVINMCYMFQNKYMLPITMSFPKEYPFRPPIVKMMNDLNYIEMLGEMQGKGINKDEKCLCCNTICCKDLWEPKKDLFDVVIEIFTILNKVYERLNDAIYKNILNKHLGYLIDYDLL